MSEIETFEAAVKKIVALYERLGYGVTFDLYGFRYYILPLSSYRAQPKEIRPFNRDGEPFIMGKQFSREERFEEVWEQRKDIKESVAIGDFKAMLDEILALFDECKLEVSWDNYYQNWCIWEWTPARRREFAEGWTSGIKK